MRNVSSQRVTDLVVQLRIEERAASANGSVRRTLAGPYTIRGKIMLEPGDTINYEMLLRRLSPDCACVVKVEVVSVREVPGREVLAR